MSKKDLSICQAAACLLAGVGLILIPCGCGMSPQKASKQADEKVYAILDRAGGDASLYRLNDPNQTMEKCQGILDEVRQSGRLNMITAVQLGLLSSPEYLAARDQLYLTGLDQTEAEHLYDLTPFAGGVGGYSKEQSTTDNKVQKYTHEVKGYQGQGGISMLLATGAMITSDFTLGSIDVLRGDYKSGSVSMFQTAITLPLLRGANRKVVLETLTQAQRNTLYQIRDFNRYRKSFVASVVTDYYRLVEQTRRTLEARDNLTVMRNLYGKMDSLASVGRLPAYELEEARQDVLKAENECAQMQRLQDELMDAFKLKLNMPLALDTHSDLNDWMGLEDFIACSLPCDQQEAIDAALSQRLDLANASDQVEDSLRHVEVAADGLKMDLALVGIATPQPRERMTFGADPGDLQRTSSRYEVAMRADFGLDRVAERNNYKRSLIALEQQQRAHVQLTNRVESEVRQAWRQMEEARERVAVQVKACELARARRDNTLSLLHYGRANTRDVLDAQEDFFGAQDGQLTAQADFAVAKMMFLLNTEMLWIQPDGSFDARPQDAAGAVAANEPHP